MTVLQEAVADVERHVHQQGWDQPPRLYALVETDDLLRREPQLASSLGLSSDQPQPGGLSAIEQDELPGFASVQELLAGILWPAEVLGTAIVLERAVLPPEAESQLPEDPDAALSAIAEHPSRQDLRLAVGVLRDGTRACVARLRAHADDADVLHGPDIAPGLAEALAATLQD